MRIKPFFPLLLLFAFVISCAARKADFKSDAYFDGLQALKNGQKAKAQSFFYKSAAQDSQLSAALAQERLFELLYENKEYGAILKLNPLPLCSAQLVRRCTLCASLCTDANDTQKAAAIVQWLCENDFTNEHVRFCESQEFASFIQKNTKPLTNNADCINASLIARFRTAVYKRAYAKALNVYKEALSVNTDVNGGGFGKVYGGTTEQDATQHGKSIHGSENTSGFFNLRNTSANALREIGAAMLYGTASSQEKKEYALLFSEASSIYETHSEHAFYCHLYSARLYGQCGEHCRAQAAQLLKSAMEHTNDAQLFDKALWFYFNGMYKISTRAFINALQEYAPQWHDGSYFDDLLNSVSHDLLKEKNWKNYYALYEFLQPYLSGVPLSQYAYIAGRLGETGLLGKNFSKAAYESAFKKAYQNTSGGLYYRFLAAERLNIPFADMYTALFKSTDYGQSQTPVSADAADGGNALTDTAGTGGKMQNTDRQNNPKDSGDGQHGSEQRAGVGQNSAGGQKDKKAVYKEAEKLIVRCMENDYTAEAYAFFMRFKDGLQTEQIMRISDVFANKNNYSQALRIASTAREQNRNLSDEQLKHLYPRFYRESVQQLCTQYELSEYLVYALVRSESFFDQAVVSRAGAQGLSQIMPSTASDIARKLKKNEYDLLDAHTNLEFGIFYLQELICRSNGSVLLALVSYNTGISKIRRQTASYTELSKDLLLEVLPYPETRGYGQKILSAAALYGSLYYKKNSHDIVREILQ